jgi:hypothetical protein
LWSSDGSDYGASNSEYATIGLAGAVSAGGSGVDPTSPTVSSAQGFFVQAKATANVVFNNAQRTATNNNFMRTTQEEWERIWLGVELEGEASNEILLAFIPEATEGKDDFDATKFSGNDFVSLYSLGDCRDKACLVSNQKLAIQGLPSIAEDRIVKLGLEVKKAGKFTFNINKLDNFSELHEVYLYDSQTESLTDLRINNYSTNLEAGEFNERFELRFIGGKITDLPSDLIQTGISVFSTSNQIQINFSDLQSSNSNIAIYDLMGRLVLTHSNQNKTELALDLPNSGIYIVKVENARGVVTKKFFLE